MSPPSRAALFVAISLTAACSDRAYNPQWAGGVPLVADVNGDGVEDMLTYGSGYELSALDGKTYKTLWKRKGLDLDGYNARRLGAIAGRTLVMAPRDTKDRALLLLDLADGRTRATVALGDKPSSLCAAGDKVWVTQIDRKTGLLDATTGALDVTAAMPAACEPRRGASYACEYARAECGALAGAPSALSLQLRDGAAAIGVEIKDPGTPEVTLVLADGRRVLFDRQGARIHAADLASGLLFLKRTGEITAIEAASGAPMWSLPCSGSTPVMRATSTRLYAECEGHRNYKALRVLDHSGKVLKDLGEPRS